MNKYKNLMKDSFIFALGSIGSKLILFFLVPLYTNFLTKPEYGVSDLIFTIAQLVTPFVALAIHNAVSRFGLMKDRRKEDVLLASFVVMGAGTVLTVAATPLVGLYQSIAEWRWYLTLYVILSFFNHSVMNYIKISDRNKIYAAISVLHTLFTAVLNILLLAVWHMGIEGYMIAHCLSMFLANILAFTAGKVFPALKKARFDAELLKQMVIYSAPLILNDLAWWVVHSSDKLMIEMMMVEGAAALGIYTAATKIPSLINTLMTIFAKAWGLGSVREYESTKDRSFYSRVFRVYVTACFGLCIALVTVMKPFMSVYVGKEFIEAWHYVPILLAAAAFLAVAYFYGPIYSAMKLSMHTMMTTVLSAVVNFAVNFALIPRIGIMGAAVGTLVAYIAMAIARQIDVGRLFPFPYDRTRLILNGLITLAHAVLVSLDFHIWLVSAAAIALYLAINWQTIRLILSQGSKLLKKRRKK